MKQQAMSSGAEIITNDAERITSKDDIFTVYTQTNSYKAKAIILATGRKRKSMPMYDKMYGKGVSYCAVCDGFFYKDAITVVIGSGNTAVSDAVYI
jgi:Thioredoxin reductase